VARLDGPCSGSPRMRATSRRQVSLVVALLG
jgi:hypothetical protein